jgi:hypothetical protein
MQEELLLLVDSKQKKFVKQDVTFINTHSLKTSLTKLRKCDVVRLVRKLNVNLRSTDIDTITEVPGGWMIKVLRHCLTHYGTFKIKYREYATEG